MFCHTCQLTLDRAPIGVLCRREAEGDEMTPAICFECRRRIWNINADVQDGVRTFTIENPIVHREPQLHGREPCNPPSYSKMPGTPAPCSTQQCSSEESRAQSNCWNCHRCCAYVASAPRNYDGIIEPHDWWWCRACQTQGRIQPCAACRPRNGQPRVLDKHSQTLDRWLLKK